MTKNHEPTIWTRIGWHIDNHSTVYSIAVFWLAVFSFLIWLAVADQRRIDAQRAVQQACVLHGKVPAEVYGEIVCIDPEALR